jgi:hypothetical protein
MHFGLLAWYRYGGILLVGALKQPWRLLPMLRW